MIIFKREFKVNLKSLMMWSLSLSAIILIMLSIYPQLASEHQNIAKLIESLPDSFRNAFNMDAVDISTLIGFYSLESYIMITLLGSIYATILASGILSKEENDHTAEFLLSKPVSRKRIATEKLIVVFLNLIIFNITVAIASLLGFQFSENSDVPMDTFFALILGAFFLHVTFASIAFLLSSFVTKSRKILALSLGLVLVMYFLSIVAGLSEKLKILGYLTPFEFVKAADILLSHSLDVLYVVIMLLLSVVSITLAYMVYGRKDMQV